MKYAFDKGTTSVIVPVFIQDSSSPTGAGLGSLDESSSIVGGYLRPGSTGVALAVDQNVATEGTYEAPSTAAQIRIGTPANMRTGTYELHVHNDLLATAADAVFITLGGATDMADLVIEIQLTDNVWDEVLTGATHNIATSSGRRLRQIEAAFVLHSGTAQDGSTNSITLDTGASDVDDFYNHARVVIVEGTGIEQERLITRYDGSGRVATVAPPWVVDPVNGSVFEVEPALSHAETGWATIRVGLAQAGGASTITLDTDASAANDFYNCDVVFIDAGTGVGQVRAITGYVGATRVATVHTAWGTNPDSTSEFVIEEAHPYLGGYGVAGAGLTALPWNAAWDAEVESEVNDAIDTAISELGVAEPTATPTIRTGLMLMYMALRNKLVVQTSGTDALEVYNNAGTLICKKLLTDDGSDYIEAEMTSG